MQAENTNGYDRCSCCLAEGQHKYAEVFHVKMFRKYLNLIVTWDSGITPVICSACEEFLHEVKKFREKVISSQRMLLNTNVHNAALNVTDNQDDNYDDGVVMAGEENTVEFHSVVSENSKSPNVTGHKGETIKEAELSPEYLIDWDTLEDVKFDVKDEATDTISKSESKRKINDAKFDVKKRTKFNYKPDTKSRNINKKNSSLKIEKGSSSVKKRANDDIEDDDDEEDNDEDDDGDDSKLGSGFCPSQKLKGTRTVWKNEEVEVLIDILIEKHIVDKLDGKCGRLPRATVYKSVAVALNQRSVGSKKSMKHVKTKFRKLREIFLETEKHNRTSGNDKKECPNYDKLKILFGKRPKVTSATWGFDSGSDAGGVSREDPDLSMPPTSATDGDTTPKIPKKTLPPKYRSGQGTSTVGLLKELLKKEEKEAQAQREWATEMFRKQEERDEKLLKGFMTTMTTGMENVMKMFLQNNQQPQQQFIPSQGPALGQFSANTFSPPVPSTVVSNSPTSNQTQIHSVQSASPARSNTPLSPVVPPNSHNTNSGQRTLFIRPTNGQLLKVVKSFPNPKPN